MTRVVGSIEIDDDITPPPLPITTHGKNAMHECMHVFLYDAQTNGAELFTIYQKLQIYKYNIYLASVQCIIEREFTTN